MRFTVIMSLSLTWTIGMFNPLTRRSRQFGLGINQSASGLEIDSLDFLLNLAT